MSVAVRGVDSPAAGRSTLRGVLALETCHCCQTIAPAWSAPEYLDWHVVSTADGESLGVVCAGCLIDHELILLELESCSQQQAA